MADKDDELIKENIKDSAMTRIAWKYDKNTVLNYARQSNYDASDIELLFVLSNYLDWGISKKLDPSDLAKLFSEITKIKNKLTFNNTPNILFAMLRNIRTIRPYWLTIPFYKEILAPFGSQVKENTGFNTDEIFDAIFRAVLASNPCKPPTTEEILNLDLWKEPEPLKMLWERYSVNLSDLRTFGDIWDKSLINVDDNFRVALTYKLPETIYKSICRDLYRTSKRSRSSKGKSLEEAISNQIKPFFQSFCLKKRVKLRKDNSKETDLVIEGKDFAFLIESKSAAFRGGSLDQSGLDAIRDAGKLIEGVSQLSPFLKAFKDGNEELKSPNGNIDVIRDHPLVLGAVITDDIYTTIAIDSVFNNDEAGEIEKNAKDTLQKYPIWIASIFDLKFLLLVSQTPSILFHYIINFRSRRISDLMEEADSWYVYAGLLEDPDGLIMLGDRLMADDYFWTDKWWDLLKNGNALCAFPRWLVNSMDEIRSLDKEGRILDSMEVIDEKFQTAVKKFQEKYEKKIIFNKRNDPNWSVWKIKKRN